jgi:hypothetical protein
MAGNDGRHLGCSTLISRHFDRSNTYRIRGRNWLCPHSVDTELDGMLDFRVLVCLRNYKGWLEILGADVSRGLQAKGCAHRVDGKKILY